MVVEKDKLDLETKQLEFEKEKWKTVGDFFAMKKEKMAWEVRYFRMKSEKLERGYLGIQ